MVELGSLTVDSLCICCLKWEYLNPFWKVNKRCYKSKSRLSVVMDLFKNWGNSLYSFYHKILVLHWNGDVFL